MLCSEQVEKRNASATKRTTAAVLLMLSHFFLDHSNAIAAPMMFNEYQLAYKTSIGDYSRSSPCGKFVLRRGTGLSIY